MGSSRAQDRSLNGGISLPQWMKGNKMDNQFDFSEGTFSPPSDDNFFYYRVKKEESIINNSTSSSTSSQGFVVTDKGVESNQFGAATSKQDVKQIDFSKHPVPCHPFIPLNGKEAKPAVKATAGVKLLKSQGTDDGFHSEASLCGKSIVHVANQMMAGKFVKSNNINSDQQQQNDNIPMKGSKSLPVTPLASPMNTPDSSPKARRKIHSNRYFTPAYIPDRDKYQGGWLLAGLMSQSREFVNSKIDEEDETQQEAVPPPKPLSRKKSISSQNLTYLNKEENNKPKIVLASSELREMNFWSPTSM